MMQAALCAAFLSAGSVYEGSSTYYRDKNWVVFETAPACTLVGYFESNKILWVRHTYDLDDALVTLTSSNFQSASAEKTYMAKIEFVEKRSLSKQYPAQIFKGTVRGAYRGIERVVPAQEFLRYLAQSEIIAVSLSDNNVLASLKLDHSALAVGALNHCSKQMAVKVPSDPLDGAEISKLPAQK